MISPASNNRYYSSRFMLTLHNYARRIQIYASNYARLCFYAGRFNLMFITPARQNIDNIVIIQYARQGTLSICSCCRERDSRFQHVLWCMVTWPPTRQCIMYVACLSVPWLMFHATAPTAPDRSDTFLHTRTTAVPSRRLLERSNYVYYSSIPSVHTSIIMWSCVVTTLSPSIHLLPLCIHRSCVAVHFLLPSRLMC